MKKTRDQEGVFLLIFSQAGPMADVVQQEELEVRSQKSEVKEREKIRRWAERSLESRAKKKNRAKHAKTKQKPAEEEEEEAKRRERYKKGLAFPRLAPDSLPPSPSPSPDSLFLTLILSNSSLLYSPSRLDFYHHRRRRRRPSSCHQVSL
ncbi:uncharacterized protein ARB_06665 [Trichophyton benhamiae CBS 112371]|uniref:Uncharacterized protein n=1 Tax=Arthroderma benhamiae (strain ATCC MYA-4681 / CBS 112371) TaxID=663331 RepID=D4ARC5_ARTBC|nr:uncharacterized protein ARB_06665 [Trichophyton benhamiae CBS 112371]EFE34268.1 hypothetical protein ARB_06665 [Trichophyton benhamiae CBS 112371]